MEYYKYVHLIWSEETKFAPRVVAMINDPEAGFYKAEHLFVTPYQSMYDFLSGYDNIVLDTSGDNLFNKYGPHCSFIFSHGNGDLRTIFTAKRKYTKKTIWRNYGGNRTVMPYEGNAINRTKIWFFNFLTRIWFNLRFNRFAAIGIANFVDEVDIRKINKSIPLLPMNYSQFTKEQMDESLRGNRERDGFVNILVGHRGTPGEQHRKILSLLKHFSEHPLRAFLILSYGDKDYIERLKTDIQQVSNFEVVVIEDYMSLGEYYRFLSNMDLIMIDEMRSSALGCVLRSLRLRKKIFLNKRGVLKEAFDIDNLPYALIDDIPHMSFRELIEPPVYTPGPHRLLSNGNRYKNAVNNWHKLLEFADTNNSHE